MALSVGQWKKYRSRFAWAFVICFGVLLISTASHFVLSAKARSPEVRPEIRTPAPKIRNREIRPENKRHGSPAPSESALCRAIREIEKDWTVPALFSGATSLVDYIFTWRKERRQRQKDELDLEIKRLELEKLRIDVERWKESSRPPSKPKNGA
jgi:hypothetical protein